MSFFEVLQMITTEITTDIKNKTVYYIQILLYLKGLKITLKHEMLFQ